MTQADDYIWVTILVEWDIAINTVLLTFLHSAQNFNVPSINSIYWKFSLIFKFTIKFPRKLQQKC